MESWVLVTFLAIYGILPIIYSVIFFIITLRQLGQLQDELAKLSYERIGIQDVVETIGQHLGDIEDEVIDVKELKAQLTFIQMATNRMVDLFTVLNSTISEIIERYERTSNES